MNKKHIVFISLPMSGIPDDIVKDNIVNAKSVYIRKYWANKDVRDLAFVNTMDNPHPPEYMEPDKFGVWYLGFSLTKLAQCDEAFFFKGWEKARGCRIENKVCKMYGIPVSYMEEVNNNG